MVVSAHFVNATRDNQRQNDCRDENNPLDHFFLLLWLIGAGICRLSRFFRLRPLRQTDLRWSSFWRVSGADLRIYGRDL
jgi:hypothetical protein